MSDTPRTIVIPGPFYGLTTDELYLKADALRAHAERLAEALEEARDAILNGRGPLESVLDNDQTNAALGAFDDATNQALTLYRAENPNP